MKIKTLTARGLKAGDFTHELGAVNLVTGANFTGKTARLDAIRLGLLGFLPELGKQGASTFALANNGSLSVGLTTDTGLTSQRSWLSDKGRVKSTESGDLPTTPPVLMDPQEYFALGEKDRVRYVFGLADLESKTGVADTLIANLKRIKCSEHEAAHERKIAELCGLVDDTDRERHESSGSVQEWIDELIKRVRDDARTAKQVADRMNKTVQGNESLTASVTPASDVTDQLQEANTTRDGLVTRRAELFSERTRLTGIEAERSRLERFASGCVDQSDKRLFLIMVAREGEIAAATKGFVSKRAEAMGNLREIEGTIKSDSRRLAEIKAERKAANAKFDAEIVQPGCPYCGACADGWQNQIKDGFNLQNEKFTEQIESLTQSLAALGYTQDKATAALAAETLLDAEQEKLNSELWGIRENLKKIDAEVKALDNARAQLDGIEVIAPTKLAEIQGSLDALETELGSIDAQIAVLNAANRRFVEAQQDEARQAAAQIARMEISTDIEVLKEAVKMLESFQAHLVAEVFGDLLNAANKVTTGILRSPLEYREGEIGRTEGSVWVSHRTFSGTEKAIAYAGMSLALAKDAPVRIVMIDELGRLDAENKTLLLQRMVELTTAGTLDQFIGVDATGSAPVAGVTMISV